MSDSRDLQQRHVERSESQLSIIELTEVTVGGQFVCVSSPDTYCYEW